MLVRERGLLAAAVGGELERIVALELPGDVQLRRVVGEVVRGVQGRKVVAVRTQGRRRNGGGMRRGARHEHNEMPSELGHDGEMRGGGGSRAGSA